MLGWATFKEFFAGAAIDYTFSAELSGYPLINDATIDDAVPFKKASELVALTIHQFLQTDQSFGSPQRFCRQV